MHRRSSFAESRYVGSHRDADRARRRRTAEPLLLVRKRAWPGASPAPHRRAATDPSLSRPGGRGAIWPPSRAQPCHRGGTTPHEAARYRDRVRVAARMERWRRLSHDRLESERAAWQAHGCAARSRAQPERDAAARLRPADDAATRERPQARLRRDRGALVGNDRRTRQRPRRVSSHSRTRSSPLGRPVRPDRRSPASPTRSTASSRGSRKRTTLEPSRTFAITCANVR